MQEAQDQGSQALPVLSLVESWRRLDTFLRKLFGFLWLPDFRASRRLLKWRVAGFLGGNTRMMAVLNTVVTEEQTVVDNDAAKHHTHTQMYTYALGLTCTDSGDRARLQLPQKSEPASALALLTWAPGASAGQSFYEHHPAFRNLAQTC